MRYPNRFLASLALGFVSFSAFATDHTVIVGRDNTNTPALAFNPSTLTINAGDRVIFTNPDAGFHNAHSTGGPTAFECSVDCTTTNTPNGTAWTSPPVTFSTAGTVTYQCDQHAGLGMTGTIIVNATTPVTLQSMDVEP